jgi:hypothetical protein
MALSPPQLVSLLGVAREESVASGLAGFLYQGVAVAAAFEDSGFDTVGMVGDFTVREMFEKWAAGGAAACGGVGEAGGARPEVICRGVPRSLGERSEIGSP